MNLQPHSKRGKPARWAWAAVGLYGALLAWPAWGQNMIRAITGSSVGGVDTVRVELSEPLAAVPSGFALSLIHI